jgi:hypothetical protein
VEALAVTNIPCGCLNILGYECCKSTHLLTPDKDFLRGSKGSSIKSHKSDNPG